MLHQQQTLKLAVMLGLLVSFPILIHAYQNEHTASADCSSALTRAPSSAAKKKNPYGSQGEAILAGKKLFRRHCADCHGGDASGTKRAPGLSCGGIAVLVPDQRRSEARNALLVRAAQPATLADCELLRVVECGRKSGENGKPLIHGIH